MCWLCVLISFDYESMSVGRGLHVYTAVCKIQIDRIQRTNPCPLSTCELVKSVIRGGGATVETKVTMSGRPIHSKR